MSKSYWTNKKAVETLLHNLTQNPQGIFNGVVEEYKQPISTDYRVANFIKHQTKK